MELREEEIVKLSREDMEEAGRGNREEDIEEKICQVVKRMKEGKAAGIDGIPMEDWLYGGKTIKMVILI